MDRFASGAGPSSWKKHHYTLYAVSGLIMARSIFRVIEYAMGQKGYLLSHEWTMYTFDSLLDVCSHGNLGILAPGRPSWAHL